MNGFKFWKVNKQAFVCPRCGKQSQYQENIVKCKHIKNNKNNKTQE